MDQKLEQDLNLSHAILNYLTATYQGRFAALNILQQLKYEGISSQEIERTRSILEKTRRWTDDLWNQIALFSTEWTQAETFDAQACLKYTEEIHEELLIVANETAAYLGDAGTPQKPPQIKYLIAAYGRFAYSRDNYIRGFIELGKRLNKPDVLQYYSSLQGGTKQDVDTAHAMLNAYKDPTQATEGFFASLFQECVALPGVLRTHAHDISLLVAQFYGGVSFERLGFTMSDALEWQGQSFAPAQAGYWRAYSLTPAESVRWVQAGVQSPALAFEWKLLAIEPQDAQRWIQGGVPAAVARRWIDAGYPPDRALDMMARGVKFPPE